MLPHTYLLQKTSSTTTTDAEEEEAYFKFTKPNPNDVFLNECTRPGALPEVYLEDLKHKTR